MRLLQASNKLRQGPRTNGFSTVELLIALVISVLLLGAGFQLISSLISASSATELGVSANSAAKDLLQTYKLEATSPCSEKSATPAIPPAYNKLIDSSATAEITCPYGDTSDISQITVTVRYDSDQSALASALVNLTASINCAPGYIAVPGNPAYGTDSFCVMKYEAKNVGGVATSQASGTLWTNQTQSSASTISALSCAGCHLITDAEWMTIAANVLSVKDNWSSGTVGIGFVFQGHVDNNPSSGLAASIDDNNGLVGMAATGSAVGTNTRRTLKLTNGEVIWDLSGNLAEWTDGTLGNGLVDRPLPATGWVQYPTITSWGNMPESSKDPLAKTGIAGATAWDDTNGIGQIYTNAPAGPRSFVRGGGWDGSIYAGVLCLGTNFGPTDSANNIGFRVAAPPT